MLRSKFIGTILVIILGVNIGAWTLSVATTPLSSITAAAVRVPISGSAIDAQSQAASVALTQTEIMNDSTMSGNATDTIATSTPTPGPTAL
jgi:hypothetical protein